MLKINISELIHHDIMISELQKKARLHRPAAGPGAGIEWERMLSPLLIESDTCGTRSSTIIRIYRDETLEVSEQTYDHPGRNDIFSTAYFSLPPYTIS